MLYRRAKENKSGSASRTQKPAAAHPPKKNTPSENEGSLSCAGSSIRIVTNAATKGYV